MRALIFSVLVLAMAGCSEGGAGGPGGVMTASNPLCSALCTNTTKNQICTDQTVSTYAIECDARVAGKSSLCQTCLVEKAYFGAGPQNAPFCDSETKQCEDSFNGKTCSWTQGNAVEEQACKDMLYAPKSYAGCDADYRPVTECASVCTG